MKHSHKILFMIMSVELIISSFYFMYGSKGIRDIQALRHEDENIATSITTLKQEIATLESQIKDWQQFDWKKEQIAREELQFAKPDEEIFLY